MFKHRTEKHRRLFRANSCEAACIRKLSNKFDLFNKFRSTNSVYQKFSLLICKELNIESHK